MHLGSSAVFLSVLNQTHLKVKNNKVKKKYVSYIYITCKNRGLTVVE